MMKLRAKSILCDDGWCEDYIIEFSRGGPIKDLRPFDPKRDVGRDIKETGVILPGIQNTHSHAFQRAMAGLSEKAFGANDSFWSWRDTMYRFLNQLTPDHCRAIASQCYLEMVKSGYIGVCEFHYLHHQPDGMAYDDPALMSSAILDAQNQVGLDLTLLPVLYQYSGFGKKPIEGSQKRFYHSTDRYLSLLDRLVSGQSDRKAVIGSAFHSLRAVDFESLRALEQQIRSIIGPAPMHIHIAEQMREVNDCKHHLGKSPVAALYDQITPDHTNCLIHATHITTDEMDLICQSGAIVGLAPTTEANLGDGYFPIADFWRSGGQISVGSDSNICLSLPEEMRMLEYQARLKHQGRNILREPNLNHTGESLYLRCREGGQLAAGRNKDGLKIGGPATFIALDHYHPMMIGKTGREMLDSFIFTQSFSSPVSEVVCQGQYLVENGLHPEEERIKRDFYAAMHDILG